MPSKVSLIYPNNNIDSIPILPPLGICYISSFLKEKGFEVEISDFNTLKNWKKKVYEIVDSKPDVIGLSSNVSNFNNTHYLANFIKSLNKDIEIIVGGPYPTCVPEKYIQNQSIDAVFIGEAEYTLYKYMSEGKKTNGLMIRKNGNIIKTGPSQYIDNLDELPFPDLKQLDMKKYYNSFQKRSPTSIIITSRGCPFNCTFCFHEVHGYKCRVRSPKNVIEEIKWQVNEIGVRELNFMDDNLILNRKRAVDIFDLMAKENLDVGSVAYSGLRPDLTTKNILVKMKKAGFWSIALAPETGNPYILKKIKKGFTLKDIDRVVEWCKELDFFLIMYFVMGFPFEKLEHVFDTINYIKKINPDFMSIHKFYPFPNTPIIEEYNLETYDGLDYKTAKIPKKFNKLYNSIYFRYYFNPTNMVNLSLKLGLKNFLYRLVFKYIKSIINNKFRNFDYVD